jgi:hypothetical protein
MFFFVWQNFSKTSLVYGDFSKIARCARIYDMEALDNFLRDKYKKKRAIIVAVFMAVVLALSSFVYFMLRPAPSCFDGAKNQNEEGIDCGGVCAEKCDKPIIIDLSVSEKGFLDSGAVGKYDLYGKILNPNNTFGGGKFKYEFDLKDAKGNVIAVKSGYSFILPGESKYILENNIDAGSVPADMGFKVTETQWVHFQDHYQKPQIKVVNRNYGEIHSGIGFSEATGLLKNESPFDFSLIKLAIILKDANDKVLAVNSTEMRTVRNGENRDFRALWLNRFNGEVMNVEVQADANVFDSDTFAERNFSPEYMQNSGYR